MSLREDFTSMKRLIAISLTVLLLAALSACAPASKTPVRVKCPACGYEFDVPQR